MDFEDEKYGLFIHWGIYTVPAGEYKGRKMNANAEWIMNAFNIPKEEYEAYAEQFAPFDFDADRIVRTAKEDWGMHYIVFTSKHHDGFAMYDSAVSDYNVVKRSPLHRDFLKELSEACRKYDMPLGLYYSQAQDWNDENGYRTDPFGTLHEEDNAGRDFSSYLDTKAIPQIRELLTNYGPVALLWCDVPMGSRPEDSRRIVDTVKSLQPDCLISGRIGNHLGDYMSTGDNFIPAQPYPGRWEVPATVNNTWGFSRSDTAWKTPDSIIELLMKIVSRGGNYLLNIGPDCMGNVPAACAAVLSSVGKFVKENGEAIFGTRSVPAYPYDLPYLIMTGRDFRLYLTLLKPVDTVDLLNFGSKVDRAYLLRDGRALKYKQIIVCETDRLLSVSLPDDLKKECLYTICLELKDRRPVFNPIIL